MAFDQVHGVQSKSIMTPGCQDIHRLGVAIITGYAHYLIKVAQQRFRQLSYRHSGAFRSHIAAANYRTFSARLIRTGGDI
jgi:hypothetical protein